MNEIDKYSHILKKEKGIECRMYGLHYAGPDKIYDGKIHTIALGYGIAKRMKLKEARKLFYEMVDGLLTHLNEDKKIRKYFFHHPLTYNDLEFHLSFDYEDKGFLQRDDVSSIHISDNEIAYFIVAVDNFSNQLEVKETSSGTKTLSFTGLDSMRVIRHKLPEAENMNPNGTK
ncbi:MAG: hypothetical protein JSS32_08200 [Verrucomicrobia bacterium]|nr:hypothetical protein [Verrucomicrobiota bacterium]